MEEYEYSFNVTSVEPYIKYCEENGYEKKGENTQNRIVYENIHNRHIIARLTTTDKGGATKKVFDCKNVSKSHDDLKVSNETIPLEVTPENEEIVKSIIEVLDFEKASDLYRTRRVYEKNGVTFEIDDYTIPVMHVIAIEGEREKVDCLYLELKNKFNNVVEK